MSMKVLLWKLSKTSLRLGAVGGTIYYTNREGLWGSQDESVSFFKKQLAILLNNEKIVSKEVADNILAKFENIAVWSDPAHEPLADKWNRSLLHMIQGLLAVPGFFDINKYPSVKKIFVEE